MTGHTHIVTTSVRATKVKKEDRVYKHYLARTIRTAGWIAIALILSPIALAAIGASVSNQASDLEVQVAVQASEVGGWAVAMGSAGFFVAMILLALWPLHAAIKRDHPNSHLVTLAQLIPIFGWFASLFWAYMPHLGAQVTVVQQPIPQPDAGGMMENTSLRPQS